MKFCSIHQVHVEDTGCPDCAAKIKELRMKAKEPRFAELLPGGKLKPVSVAEYEKEEKRRVPWPLEGKHNELLAAYSRHDTALTNALGTGRLRNDNRDNFYGTQYLGEPWIDHHACAARLEWRLLELLNSNSRQSTIVLVAELTHLGLEITDLGKRILDTEPKLYEDTKELGARVSWLLRVHERDAIGEKFPSDAGYMRVVCGEILRLPRVFPRGKPRSRTFSVPAAALQQVERKAEAYVRAELHKMVQRFTGIDFGHDQDVTVLYSLHDSIVVELKPRAGKELSVVTREVLERLKQDWLGAYPAMTPYMEAINQEKRNKRARFCGFHPAELSDAVVKERIKAASDLLTPLAASKHIRGAAMDMAEGVTNKLPVDVVIPVLYRDTEEYRVAVKATKDLEAECGVPVQFGVSWFDAVPVAAEVMEKAKADAKDKAATSFVAGTGLDLGQAKEITVHTRALGLGELVSTPRQLRFVFDKSKTVRRVALQQDTPVASGKAFCTKHFHMYNVNPGCLDCHPDRAPTAKPVKMCGCCGAAAQGNYAIDYDGSFEKTSEHDVDLCDACGGSPTEVLSCDQIWDRIKERRARGIIP